MNGESGVGRKDIESRLQELELELLQAQVRRNPERLSSLLAEEFREFGSSGRVFKKNEIIEALQTESTVTFSVSDFRVNILNEGVALITYQASRREALTGTVRCSLRSSLWIIRDARWQMLFHQGTKTL